ncbi:hypothetical protein [Micromonospora wenchangensis]|uniref:hypothetical protein n=1 Tax=Micromonospora wenchangensis TaxID=1185415 RepID=UPI00381F4CCD
MTPTPRQITDDAEPPETHPAHRVEIEAGKGPTVEFQALPLDDFFAETPHVDFTYRVEGGDNELVFSYRTMLSDGDMGAIIDALSRAREDARRQAALFGWSPPEV